LSKAFFATPQDVEAAFYKAIEHADLEEMMQVWAEDEEIVCIHPNGPRLAGYAKVREAWRRIFSSGALLRMQVMPLGFIVNPFTAVHSIAQQVIVKEDPSQQIAVISTNVYSRGASGWRLIVHHSSHTPPDSFSESPKVLH
jgi:ketosteroid isomerase-like protein